jgi:hypothetical protein
LLTILDYEHGGELAEFDAYSRRQTPRVFLGLLESRASTNQLSGEIKDEIMDIVQECCRFVYQQYQQDAIEIVPAAADSTERLSSRRLPLLSNNSSSDNSNESGIANGNDIGYVTQLGPSRTHTLDLSDFDADEFQRIFGDNSMLGSEYFAFNYMDPKQKACYCPGSCSCPPSTF